MKKIIIDGNKIGSREELFASLKEQLPSEGFYGNNLDALADVLSELAEPVEAEIIGPGALRAALGEYADRLLRVLWDYCGDLR